MNVIERSPCVGIRNFLDNEHFLLGWGPLRLTEAHELFALWQSNFMAYHQLESFTVTVSGD